MTYNLIVFLTTSGTVMSEKDVYLLFKCCVSGVTNIGTMVSDFINVFGLEPTFTTFVVSNPFLSVIFDPVMRNHRYRLSFFMITTCTMSFLNTVY